MHRHLVACTLALAASPAVAVDGLLDSSFGIFSSGRNLVALDQGGTNADTLADVLVGADGRIFLVGTSEGPGGSSRYSITRLAANGLVDASFGTDGTVYSGASNVIARRARFDGAGNILILGAQKFAAEDRDFHVCRYNVQGEAVPFTGPGTPCIRIAFDIAGGNLADVANDFLVDPLGRIVIAGVAGVSATSEFAALARISADGTLDASFGDGGKRVHAPAAGQINRFNAIARRADGKFIAVGEAGDRSAQDGTGALFARLTVNGTLDPTYQSGNGFTRYNVNQGEPFNRDEAALSVKILSDGSMLMAGSAENLSSSDRRIVFVYKIPEADFAAIDTSFGNNGITRLGAGYSFDFGDMLVQSDGAIVLLGTSRATAAPALDMHVLRLDADGGLDSSGFGVVGRTTIDFLTAGELDHGVRAASQNGRLIVAGHSLSGPGPQNYDLTVARLANDLIFANGFE